MAISSNDAPKRSRASAVGDDVESTAAGIYGVIVSAAVLAASHRETATATAVSVLVTLLVYWVAERYARLVAERIHEGHRPRRAHVVEVLTSGWEMITASLLPLGVLLLSRLLGASLDGAILAALITCTILLGAAGWNMARHASMEPHERVISAMTAAAFGIALIVLKALLH